MRDWETYVRTHLPLPHLTRERESRIVLELASQLEDFHREAVARGMTESDADAFARAQITDWNSLASTLGKVDGAHMRSHLDRWSERRAMTSRGRQRATAAPRQTGVTTFLYDLQHAARALRKNPGFLAVVVLTLGCGIGINTATFSGIL